MNLVFGLGSNTQIDSVTVIWPDDQMQSLHNIKADTELKLDYAVAKKTWEIPVEAVSTFVLEDVTTNLNFDFLHQENDYVDYNRDGLLKQMYSTQGPALAVGDVNGDGLDDAYIGGGAGKLRVLFVQQSNGKFIQSSQTAFTVPNPADETAATFFDADGDKDLDFEGWNGAPPGFHAIIALINRRCGREVLHMPEEKTLLQAERFRDKAEFEEYIRNLATKKD